MSKKKRMLGVFILIVCVITGLSSISMAINDPISDPGAYRPGNMSTGDTDVVTSKAGIIINIATTLGIVVAVITIIIVGIKYMVGSVEEKAEYKKTMAPYLIGVIMIGGISTIVKLIANIVGSIE